MRCLDQLENRITKGINERPPPFVPQEQRDGTEVQNPQGSRRGRDRWATQRRSSELRRGHPPSSVIRSSPQLGLKCGKRQERGFYPLFGWWYTLAADAILLIQSLILNRC